MSQFSAAGRVLSELGRCGSRINPVRCGSTLPGITRTCGGPLNGGHRSLLSARSGFSHEYRRTLFSSEILGLEGYERQKASLVDRLGDSRSKFISRMREYIDGPATNTVFTDDLRTMVYISETDEELDTTLKMARRFHSQNNDLRFSNFSFGPLIMRLLYVLKKADLALQLYRDEQTLPDFFSQRSSWLVLMDLLYEQRRYGDVLNVMTSICKVIQQSRAQGKVKVVDAGGDDLDRNFVPLDCITVSMAAAYKLNTAESLQFVVELLKEVNTLNGRVTLRSAVFAAMLALQQNKADMSLEILTVPQSDERRGTPIAYINVKALTYVRLGRLPDAVQLLKSVLERDQPDYVRVGDEILQDVLLEIKESVIKSGDKDLTRQIENVERSLRQTNRVAALTLSQYLERPILRRRKLQDGYKQRQRPAPSVGLGDRRPRGRPGLLD